MSHIFLDNYRLPPSEVNPKGFANDVMYHLTVK
jgi:hypothetical protein